MAAEIGQMLHEVVVDFRARVCLADDEALISKIVPTDLFTLGQAVTSGDDHKNTLVPKTGRLAAMGSRFAREKGDIHAVMLNGSNVFRGTTFDKIEMNERIVHLIGLQQVGEEARGQRRKDADPHHADLAASCRTGILQGIFDATDRHASVAQEFDPRIGELHATRMADEQGNTDVVFQISYSPTYS